MPEVQIANTDEVTYRSASGSDSLLALAVHPDRPFDQEAADLYNSPLEMRQLSAMNWGPSSNSQVNQSLDVDSIELTRRSTGMKINGRSMPPSHASSLEMKDWSAAVSMIAPSAESFASSLLTNPSASPFDLFR